MSPLSKTTNPERTSQFKLVKDPNSNQVNNLFIKRTVPVTLYDKLLTFPDKDTKFKLQGDLSKKITSKNYIVDLAKLTAISGKKSLLLQKKCISTKEG